MEMDMKISARVENSLGQHTIRLRTNEADHSISIPPKASGLGSSANGGELLFLALATCFCNDIYREAAKRAIAVEQVEVEVDGEFGAEGEPARSISYRARVKARASEEDICELIRQTDRMAEIQNTLRSGAQVTLSGIDAIESAPGPG
jgi:organic hydroperoxide reductase OsmC/OhrA